MDIFMQLSDSDLECVQVYDDGTTLNGAPGVRYVDKINRNTSAGYPYKRSKRFFLSPMNAEDCVSPTDVVFCDEIMEQVRSMIETYEQGVMCHPIFNGNLKDEPKKAGKMTRVFMGASAAASFVCRKYLLSVIKLIQENKFIFECGPGTVARIS